MNNITKVSDITYQDVADYLRIDEIGDDANTLNMILISAKVYIGEYTGRDLAELDTLKDVIIAVFVLCGDMWDNRAMYVDTTNVNKVVQSILDLHSVNLL